MRWPSKGIREEFLRFFAEREHQVVPSSSLLPPDPTLLFTNAGMNQFKNYFLGLAEPPFKRATSVQKCLRAGGKHNDLEQVGFTPRHHTFFEMLGNFSFGDYFKREAIKWAWELLTEVFEIPPERLVATVYEEDEEAYAIWRDEVGLPPERIFRLGRKDNFWEMGDVGPCGPCSELHYDFGPEADSHQADPGQEGNRFLELWNLVFMEFERLPDGSLRELPKKNIDTGAGLERLASVLQGVKSNFETDLFVPIIQEIERLTGVPEEAAHRVMADHARALVAAISDGIYPSNAGRGYILRRILRRAHTFAQRIGVSEPILWRLVPVVVEILGDVYPEMKENASVAQEVIKAEEERFLVNIKRALPKILEVIDSSEGVLKGEDAFLLYDTYGIPPDLIKDFAAQAGLRVDWEGFSEAMERQRARARAAAKFKLELPSWEVVREGKPQFVGYERLAVKTRVLKAARGEGKGFLVLEENPFYAEAGGQLADRGVVRFDGRALRVLDVQKIGEEPVLITEPWEREVPEEVEARVDEARRRAMMRAHTATHLLHAALRQVLGEGAVQKGSLVDEERLRFDFSWPRALSKDEILKIEELVNGWILEDREVVVRWVDYQRAVEEGAVALFEGKYGQRVRVVEVPGVSKELCGGTHCSRTGEIGSFLIVKEEAVAGGIRRIEAFVGMRAYRLAREALDRTGEAAKALKAKPEEVPDKVKGLLEELQELKKRLRAQELASAKEWARRLELREVGSLRVAAGVLEASPEAVRVAADVLEGRGADAIVLVGKGERAFVHVRSKVDELKANELARRLAEKLGGKGGGSPRKAEGGGPNADRAEEALRELLRELS